MSAPQPLVETRTIGAWTVHALQAGGQKLDGGAMFGVVPKPLWERRIPADERNRIPLGMRCLLIEHDDGLVLIDCGAGNKENARFLDIYGIENSGASGRTALEDALAQLGHTPEDIRIVKDPRTGKTTEVWVRWHPTPNLLFARPGAREYAVERTRGRVLFAGRSQGMIPPAGTDNILLRSYRAGGGVIGNVARGAVTQLLAGVLAQGVSNVRDAEGGADGETVAQLLERAPASLRDRRQAITALDYEAMAEAISLTS